MTHVAVACVARAALRSHCRVTDVGEILITAMNAVNHQVEIETLSRLTRVVWSGNQRGIVAKNSHLDIVAIVTMKTQIEMTLVAICDSGDRSPGLNR